MLTADDFRTILTANGYATVDGRRPDWCSPVCTPYVGPHGERAQLCPPGVTTQGCAFLSLSGGGKSDQPGSRPWTMFGGPAPVHTRQDVERWMHNPKQRAR